MEKTEKSRGIARLTPVETIRNAVNSAIDDAASMCSYITGGETGIGYLRAVFATAAEGCGAHSVIFPKLVHGSDPTRLAIATGPDWSATLELVGWREVSVRGPE